MAILAPNIKILGARVAVLQDKVEEQVGSILLPDQSKVPQRSGVVVAVGTGMMNFKGERIPMDVSVGDRVIWADLGGVPVTVDGQEYLVINQNHILAIVGYETVVHGIIEPIQEVEDTCPDF